MSLDRRDFLKITALTALFGLGSASAFKLLSPDEILANVEGAASGQLGMVIDMELFQTPTTIENVIEACNRAHNVPSIDNTKHEIKWIWTEKYENAFPENTSEHLSEELKAKPFLVLCNHCDHPACVRVCPTQATFKRKSDGIVQMDYHRCIGCRFCMAACPYGSRSFNWENPRKYIKDVNPDYPTRTIGVVEKCNFCIERIERGLKPACVDASEGAMVFGKLDDPDSAVRAALATNYAVTRKTDLGTGPNVYYIIGGQEHA
ncbi:MAG: 4Fe-4S dicluster domain-containing protein [Nitrospirae bacterium]|nr:4Fe-4S dicluster domain-containing protein [Nitrospirota bacterium]